MVNHRDIAGRQKKKKNGEPQRYSWEGKRRRRRMVNSKDIAGKAEEEDEEEAVLACHLVGKIEEVWPTFSTAGVRIVFFYVDDTDMVELSCISFRTNLSTCDG